MESRARFLIRELRGDDDTDVLSQRLGYTSDIVAEWESGRRWPTAGELFRVCQFQGVEVRSALQRFDPLSATSMVRPDDAGVAAWLAELCSDQDLGQLAGGVGRSRTVVRRWIGGQVRPLLPDLLALIGAATGRSEAFIEALLPDLIRPQAGPADPVASATRRAEGPREAVRDALAEAWRIRDLARGGPEVDLPPDEETVEVFVASEARDSLSPDDPTDRIWRALASADYATLEVHRPGWLEARTGHSRDVVLDTLHRLEGAGLVRRGQDRYHVLHHPRGVDPTPPQSAPSPLQRLARRRAAQVVVPLGEGDLQRCRAIRSRSRAELMAIARSGGGPRQLAMVRVLP